MSVRRLALFAIAALTACPGKQPPPARPDGTPPPAPVEQVDSATRLAIANAEARRSGGIATLVELVDHGKKPERLLALRGLGRIGGAQALGKLVLALQDVDPTIIAAAATAIGLATSLDEDTAGDPKITEALIAALPRANEHAPDVIEAIGRAGAASAQAVLVTKIDDPKLQAAVATALGRYGRRKIELSTEARKAMVALAGMRLDPDARVAVAWAMAREQLPKPGAADPILDDAGNALVKLLKDDVAEVRAQAASAIGKRKWTRGRGALISALDDSDWRVCVEAARGLVGEPMNDPGDSLVVAALERWLVRLGNGDEAFAQPIIEALRGFGARKTPPPGNFLLFAEHAGHASSAPPLARAWIECLADSVLVRSKAATYDALARGSCALADHYRLPLVGELITAGVGTLAVRRAALKELLAHGDARVRVAGMTALVAMWKEGDAADHRAAIATVVAALGATDAIVAGNAAEAAGTLYEHVKPGAEGRAELDAAIVARAGIEKEPELAAALFELIGKQKLASGAAACRAGLERNIVAARAGAACLEALGTPTQLATTPAAPPAIDVQQVIGKQLHWRLETTRGTITIALDSDAAPWAVATIVALTRKGFYDGIEFHRVVGNFVVQGGDPTESGWGGPGFSIPGEPSSGRGFSAGGVGMADSGRDSAGSQWFVMHSAAPHLDGRYTWVGRVESGQKSADALLIGDKVTRATIVVQN